MRYRILGPLELSDEGRVIEIPGGKQRALLAILLLDANRVVSTDRLIDALWEEAPPETAGKALQVHVSQLRKILGKERLQTKAPGYLLRVAEGELDLDHFQRLFGDGTFQEALALWRGHPLAEFGQLRFAQGEIARLEELRQACLEERIEADLLAGRHAELVGELETLVRDYPLRQRLRGQLMMALYRSGRDAEALVVYQDARKTLVDELGIEPRRALRELQQAILRQDPSLDLTAEMDAVRESERGVFVGRERELDALIAGLEDAIAGRGRLFLLAGEAGIGKSRLADEIASRSRERGAVVLWGRCWEAGGAPPYWPWVQALGSYVRERDAGQLRVALGPGSAEIAQILPELGTIAPEAPAPPARDPEAARFRLFQAVAGFLRRAAEAQPLVLVLDDLHVADVASILLLRLVGSELATMRVLIVAAYRDTELEADNPVAIGLAEAARLATRRLELHGLSQAQVAVFVEATTGISAPESVVAAIAAWTEGNPLFVGEVAQLLAAEGRLDPADNGAAPHTGIPQGVREVIGARLRRLSDACLHVLTLASVIGRDFQLDVLERVSALERTPLLDLLEEAIVARVLTDASAGPGRLRFGHELIRHTLYGGIAATQQIRLHRSVGEALEKIYARDPELHLTELAYHFTEAAPAGEAPKAVDYARRAGDRAARSFAYEEAVRLYRMALATLELAPVDETGRCELLLALADAQMRAGETVPGKETFLEAARLAAKTGAAEQLARAAIGYGGRIVWGETQGDPLLVKMLEDALAAVGNTDSTLRARLLHRLASAHREDPEPDLRTSLALEAIDVARRVGDRATLAETLLASRVTIWGPGNVDEHLEIASEIVRLADEAGDLERTVDGRLFRVEFLMMRGDMAGAHADLEAAGRLAARTGQRSAHWHVCVHRIELALLEGRFGEAEALIADALELGERSQRSDASEAFTLQGYALHRARGTVAEIEADVKRLAAERPRPFFVCLTADLELALGREVRARAIFNDLAANDFRDLRRDSDWTLAVTLLGDLAASFGDAPRASALYDLLEPYGSLNVVDAHRFSAGSAQRTLGVLAATTNRFDDAEHHFAAAAEMNAATGAQPWLAHTQNDCARMLLARGGPGDRDRAQELLGAALATYRKLGMETYAAKARSQLEAYA